MKQGTILKTVQLVSGENHIILDKIYPIETIIHPDIESVMLLINDQDSKSTYAEALKIIAKKPLLLDIKIGKGYTTVINEFYTDSFTYKEPWGGSDGIYSFNLTNGKDSFDQKEKGQTLFVFGDTFVGKVDPKTFRRYEPLLMPNNTIGYLNPQTKEVDILINQGNKGEVEAFFKLDSKFNVKGSILQNTVEYHRNHENDGYLSALYQKDIVLDFDLSKTRSISKMSIVNYYSKESESLSNRGVKSMDVLISNDFKTFEKVSTVSLKKATSKTDFQDFNLNISARFIRFIVKESHNIHEAITGLTKVEFYNGNHLLKDVIAEANSIFTQESAKAWLWLQDGVVIKDKLYFFPMIVVQDLNQPEGLQFAINGVVLMEVPIKQEKIIYEEAKQKLAPFLFEKGDYQYLFGGAIMSNTIQSGALNPDGFVYVYGYRQYLGFRQTVLGRVKEEDFTNFDDYEFYDGISWNKDITTSAPLFDHVSCEFSVSEIREGLNKGKYISVFTYDTNTVYLAYSIGDTPWGPFTEPKIYYKTPEVQKYKVTTYTYNAKAHPHLSSSTSILVSYNTNTYNFDHNMSNAHIYHPRFINMIDTTKDET